jgi:elongation factor P hydroxylase
MQQREFFSAELRTQSLERFFADVLGLTFKPSADNFEADVDAFAKAIDAYSPQLDTWLCSAGGARARVFAQALAALRSALSASAPHDGAYESIPQPIVGLRTP